MRAPILPSTTLFGTENGNTYDSAGLPATAYTPAFSPDGAWLAFNDASQSAGHVLSVMAFAPTQNTFSDYRMLVSDDVHYPAWPSFRPGSEQLVFALGERADFTANGALISCPQSVPGPRSDLYLTDRTGSPPTMLFRAMGFSAEVADDDDA